MSKKDNETQYENLKKQLEEFINESNERNMYLRNYVNNQVENLEGKFFS